MKLTEKELEKMITNYIEWYRIDCSDPYGELEWLIKTLLDSKHKEDMRQVLIDTYELYSGNFEE
jgi:hypothetical protein